MMTKKDLLNNGLLEQYVLGELNTEQEKSIESFRISDIEIADKLNDIELNFEKIGLENAITPPSHLKTNLITKLDSKEQVTPLNKKTNNRKIWLGIAASLTTFLLLGSVWLYSELNTLKEELNIVKEENTTLKDDLKTTTTTLDKNSKWYAALSNPDTKQYVLKGNILSPKTKIVSYVNHEDKSVIINTKKLPQLDDQHDYQMWADVDGVMIDMGIIPKHQQLTAMTYVNNAESLNVTIEPLGGNDHPTVERLITNVYLD